jgi:6-phosphogluconolactonase
MKPKHLIIITCLLVFSLYAQAQKFNMLVGTYTSPTKPDGIFVYEFDSQTGKATLKSQVAVESPSYITLSPDEKFVYAVSEGRSANVNALSFDKKTGALKLINQVKSGSGGPTYISIDPSAKYVFAANYGGGSLTAVPVEANGSLGADIQDIKHVGKSIKKNKPYVHSAVVSPDGKFVITCDLGNDTINVYSFDAKKRPTPLAPVQSIAVAPGAGPRLSTFSPNGKFVYIMSELNSSVNVLSYKKGHFNLIQTENALPTGYTLLADGADANVSPDGKFLYVSNRKDVNDIVIYSINKKSGKITYIGREPSQGKESRTFRIDPTGNWLLSTNQQSNDITIFKRDLKTGLLTFSSKMELARPGCIQFAKLN